MNKIIMKARSIKNVDCNNPQQSTNNPQMDSADELAMTPTWRGT